MEEITKPVPNYSADSFLQLPTDLYDKKTKTPSNERQKSIFKNQNQASTSVLSTVPWKRTDSYSCGVIGLHEEINDFYETMRPTEEEKEIRLKVIEHITRVIHSMWPHAKVEVFGSFRTGLYLPSSDIDMVVSGQWRSLPLSTLSKALQERGIFENDIIIIDNAKVPIVKLVHSPSKVKVDISFNMQNGVESAKMVKNLMKQYPTLPKLVLVLKQYLLQRGLNEVYNGGMSSYCLTLLIVSLLQGYHKPKTLPSNNLGTLLMEFFEHFGLNFNYEKVSIHFQNGGNYQPKYRSTGTILNIEDPFQKGNNIAKGTFQMHLLKMSFENAFHVLHKAITESIFSNQPLNSYLSFIINVSEDTLNERRWMSQNYSSILRKLSCLMETPHPESQGHLAAASSSNRKPAGKKKKLR